MSESGLGTKIAPWRSPSRVRLMATAVNPIPAIFNLPPFKLMDVRQIVLSSFAVFSVRLTS